MKTPLAFISYSSIDATEATKLAEMLRQRGVEVWIDQERIKLGDSIPERINDGLARCDVILILVSRNWSASSWCKAEYQALLMREINEGKTRVIPVRLDATDLPPLLASKRSFDIRTSQYPRFVYDLGYLADQIKYQANDRIISGAATNRTFHCSRLSMIIGGIVQDFPVSSMTTAHLLNGRSLFDLYKAVSHLIERFQDLVDSLVAALQDRRQLESINRKLLDVAVDMRDLSSSLQSILSEDDMLSRRLETVLKICVAVGTGEGDVLVSFGLPTPQQLEDGLRPAGYYGERTGLDFHEWFSRRQASEEWCREYARLREMLDQYRLDLRNAIAQQMAN